MAIKNIIFDLGGVFLDIHYNKTKQAFIDAGVSDFDDYFQQSHISPIFNQLERGTIAPDEFYEGFRKETKKAISNAQIESAWNAMLGDFRKEALAILPNIKAKYNTYLLSNTNAIHFHHFLLQYEALAGNSFDTQFHKTYYSHLIKQRKPDAEAYLYITDENKILPEETVFIDDTYKNIEGAMVVNMHTIWLQPGMELQNVLPAYLAENE